jgi:hypothetical protein
MIFLKKNLKIKDYFFYLDHQLYGFSYMDISYNLKNSQYFILLLIFIFVFFLNYDYFHHLFY